MNTDQRGLFISLNPLVLGERELGKDKTGFADVRTHNDYQVFLAGYKAGTVDGEEREYQRHRPMNTEGCKPESIIMLTGLPCAGAAVGRNLDKAEGGTPDNNIHPCSTPTSKALYEAKGADNELLMAQVGLLAAVRRIYPAGNHSRCSTIRQQRKNVEWESYMANVAAMKLQQLQRLQPLR